MKFKELLAKTKNVLADVGEKVADAAGKATTTVVDVAGKATSTVVDATGKAAHVVANVADDAKDAFMDFTNLRSVRERLVDTMLEATQDGNLSAEELAEFKTLQAKLEISDADMKEIKISVLKEVIKRATADGKVTTDEMKLIDELQKDLEIPTDTLQGDLEKVKALFIP